MNNKIRTLYEFCQTDGVIDIGSDHGYLLKLLNEKKGYENLLGIEVAEGPLKNLTQNIKPLIENGSAKVMLSNGLGNLTYEDSQKYNIIVAAGMGGILIWNIIEQDLEKFKNKRLILQPNSNQKSLRKQLLSNGFSILKENIIYDRKYYNCIIAEYNNINHPKYKDFEFEYGINIKKDMTFKRYLKEELKRIKKIKMKIKNEKDIPLSIIKKEKELNKRIKNYEIE